MEDRLDVTIGNRLSEVTRVAALADDLLARWNVDRATWHRVQLVLEELLSNVVRHAFDDDGPRAIDVSLRRVDGAIELVVRDDGVAFDPLAAPAVDVTAPLEQRRPGGLGIHLVRETAQALCYTRTDGRNELRVTL